MSEFQEDMIFKNVNDNDARILLDIIGKKSKTVKIRTKELRLLDPTTFKPDIMLELDNEILIIELQSTKVRKKHHKRFLVYVAITDYNNETKKEVELCVFTTAEESKQIIHRINKENEFKYDVISLSDHDSKEIINTIKHKLEHNIQITGKESVLFALTPLIEKTGNVEEYIDEVVNTLINLTGLTASIKALVFGIEWLIVDKFVKNEQQRNILCDLLGERMSLIHEYGQNKEKNGISKGEENIIRNQLKSGMKAEIIAKSAKVPLPRVKAIERKLKKEN